MNDGSVTSNDAEKPFFINSFAEHFTSEPCQWWALPGLRDRRDLRSAGRAVHGPGSKGREPGNQLGSMTADPLKGQWHVKSFHTDS